MWWWVSEKGLKMEILASTGPSISEFDKLAGQLMSEARPQRLGNGRLPETEYFRIATAPDEGRFRPLNHLEGVFRKKLAERNKKADG
jgi:hypothetical protein